MYLLDTNVIVDYLNGRHPKVTARVQGSRPDSLCTSSVVAAELRHGATRSRNARANHARLDVLLEEIRCFPFDMEAARIFGGVRSKLEASGTPIGPYDTQIAAHALALGATLVTDNIGEFTRVAGLRIENWR
jgi:tRNA(fMet)-specific endonuclease VapC